MGGWLQDLRAASRTLARKPGFALGVSLTLALGIGATTTIFSVVDTVLFRPLAYEDPEALALVGTVFPTREWDDEEAGLQHLAGISMLNFLDYAERNRSFQALAAVESASILLPDQGTGPEIVSAARVDADFFSILNVTPVMGRAFLPEDAGGSGGGVYMISYGAWERRFGGDPDVVGRPMDRVGAPGTIIGVLPADFRPPEAVFPTPPDFWMPSEPSHPRYASRGMRSLYVLGRLAPGVTVSAARDEARDIAEALAVAFPDGNVYPDGSHFGVGVNGLREETVGTTARTLRIFLGAAGLLLLLASMNAATLLLARALDRVRELSVRIALGAGRTRVMRLLLAEALLLSLVGGAIGVAFALVGVEAFLRYAPSSIPRLGDVRVDARILTVSVMVSVGAGLAAGLLPAVRLSRHGPWTRLNGRSTAGEPASRLRAWLVGGQIAVAVVLLSGAGLLSASFARIMSVDPGFEPDGLVSMSVPVKRPNAPAGEEVWQAWDGVLREIQAVAGVTSVAGASDPPFRSPSWAPRLLLPGDTPETWREGIAGYAVTPDYFETLRTEVLEGRVFDVTDGPGAAMVALVNESFVRTQLSGEDPVGLTVRQVAGDDETAVRIVGVVEDVVQTRADQGPSAAIYFPYRQVDWPSIHVLVRTDLPGEQVIPELRKAVARFSPVVPPRDVRSMRDRMASTRTTPRFHAMLIGAFALVALLLATAGLYGSLSHAVGHRRRELGVRMALGSERSGVLRLVVRQGMRIAAAGLAIGLLVTLGLTGVLRGFLFGVRPTDPLTLTAVIVILAVVSALACLLPAVRATTVDPAEVLRAE